MSEKNKKILLWNGLKITGYAALLLVNIYYLFINIMIIRTTPSPAAKDPASPFAAFQKPLAGVKEVGYLTNKDMSEEHNDGLYLMGQYALAPTVLRLNDVNATYNILDYTKPVYAVFTLRKLNAVPVATSPYGLMLIKKRL